MNQEKPNIKPSFKDLEAQSGIIGTEK